LLLKISATRWNHILEIRNGNGDITALARHQVQGDWSLDPSTGISWFNSYGLFTATAYTRVEVPWHLFDATTNEYLEADAGGNGKEFINSIDNTDNDGDGLADWYEYMIGTNPNDWDSDDDGVSDGQEVANGTNPRAGNPSSNPNPSLMVFTPLE
jgi:hypothetical protein